MAKTISVSNAADLVKALNSATGGETIVLAAGDYGNLALTQGRSLLSTFSSQVTITSADPNHPASFSGMTLNGLKNLKFDDVKFDYNAAPGAAVTTVPFSLNNCSNITITNSEFNGDKATGLGAVLDGYGTGRALAVNGGSNIVVSNNDIHDFHRGVVVSKTNGITISGNDLHGMSSDGLDFAQVTNVVIDSNKIHDFSRSPLSAAHPDMIQFWTAGTTAPSTNIRITNNLLDIGEGSSTQSIFMRNEMVDSYGAGKAMYYQNVVISNNIIRNADGHGISVGETTNLVVDNNTLLQSVTGEQGGAISIPTIYVSPVSTGVTITDNVIPSLGSTLKAPHAGWTMSNNYVATIDNPNAANYIGKLYYDALDKTHATLDDFRAVQGSTIDKLHVGAQIGAPLTASTYVGYIDAHQTSGTNAASLRQTFDASNIFNSLGKVSTAGATVTWDFGDGTKGTGLVANHVYANQGDYTAVATITLSSGKSIVIDKTVHVQSSAILDVDFNLNAQDHSPIINAVTMNSATLVATAGGGHAVALNGGVVKYDTNCDFYNNSEYSLVVDFKKDAGEETQGGRLVYLSGAYVISVGADGLTVAATTSLGTTTLKAVNLGIADTDWHRIGLSFSGETGFLKLYLDGKEVASASGLKGAVQTAATGADLYLGGPFGGSFGGQIDNLHISNTALDATTLSKGTLATAAAEFASLTQFDPVASFVASRAASPVASAQPVANVPTVAPVVIDTHANVQSAHSFQHMANFNHHDFMLI